MKIFHAATRPRTLWALALCAWGPWGVASADDNGCFYIADGIYQIGQTAQVVVTNDMAEGTIVRDEKAHGDGNILATCMQGVGTFEGDYTVPQVQSLIPLTVGGKPSGFGLELYIEELLEQRTFPFPHRYERSFNMGDPVRSNHANIGYRIKRMSGPIEFGQVDARKIAEQWTYEPGGRRTAPFRHMTIYELAFVRPSCSISTESLNQEVQVGDYSVANFATPDRATPWKEFRLTVEECQEPVGMVASFTFGTQADADSDNAEVFSLKGTDAPENVGLEIGDGSRKTIRPGEEARFNALGTGEDFVFNVRLRETKPTVRGGRFQRPVTVLVNFM
jgi:type 1 fimbria pilin